MTATPKRTLDDIERENAALRRRLADRTAELRQALDRQSATAEILKVINATPGDLAPVFDAVVAKAHALCDADYGSLQLWDGERFRGVAMRGFPEAMVDLLRRGYSPFPNVPCVRLVEGENVAHCADLAEIDDPTVRAGGVALAGIRTILYVALRKDRVLLGQIVAARRQVRPFTDGEIALVEGFAAQAVIAIENARLLTETRAALDRQTATAEVLQVINRSPGDLAPVFDAILEKAHSLCGVTYGSLHIYDDGRFAAAAVHNLPEEFAAKLRHGYPGSDAPFTRPLLAGSRLVQFADLAEIDHPIAQAAVELAGIRTALFLPLRKDDVLLGMIVSARREVRPFAEKEIALLEGFAAQAVIAIENARLLGELRERTRDLQESLEYQTATSDVLRVISRSVFKLQPVLETVVAAAVRLCRADQAVVYRRYEGEYRWAAGYTLLPEYERIEREVRIRPGTGTLVGRVALQRDIVHILDPWTDPLYEAREDARTGGVHTMLGVPLLRDGTPIGVIGLARRRIEAYTEREIALVRTFADQAVIAIENARLFDELRERTRDLEESLEYQTATSDVLKVISRSGAEIGSVLDTLVKTAARLCDAEMALIHRRQGEVYRPAAALGFPQEFIAYLEAHPLVAGQGSIAGRVASEGRAIHVADVAADREYALNQSILMAEQRTALGVPLLREGVPVGVIVLARSRVEPFTEKQIVLVSTFAAQAVIAIENARLFDELRERTAELGRSVDELTMLNEVGQAVSSTLDLHAVLSTVLGRSLAMTEADAGAVFRYSRAERAFRLVEAAGLDDGFARRVRDLKVAEGETAMSEAAERRTPIQLPDLALRPQTPLVAAGLAAGLRSALIVPLIGAERILGALVLQCRAAGEFPPETVRLMQTLASQSVLAIQNARLYREIADKSEQLALASEHKSQFLANMSHELRTPLNAILGYAELLVDGIYGTLPEKARGVLERVQSNGKHLLALINDVLDLAKIEAGQLTLTLEDYSLAELVRAVVTATEPLAAAKGLKFAARIADGLPMAHGDARRVSQVLLNLVGNAVKFTEAGEVEITAAAQNGRFLLSVRDTGPGIAAEDQERIFGEFQQIDNASTRKAGGTGLGLAISKRMVEMQGGTISVDSVLGRGSTFRVTLPVAVEPVLEEAAQ